MICSATDNAHQALVVIEDGDSSNARDMRWPTSFKTQFVHLTVRSFKQSIGRFLDFFKMFELGFLCVFLCLLWFQLPRSEDTLRDRMGLVGVVLPLGYMSNNMKSYSKYFVHWFMTKSACGVELYALFIYRVKLN